MAVVLRSLGCWWLTGVLVALLTPVVFAQSGHRVRAYSVTEFAVHYGDRLRLEIQVAGAPPVVAWTRSAARFCEALTCEIDTAAWALGTQLVTATLTYPEVIYRIRYRIRLEPAPKAAAPGLVSPPLVPAGRALEAVPRSEWTVLARGGHGVATVAGTAQVIDGVVHALGWEEALRTFPSAVLALSRSGRELDLVGPDTEVQLARTPKGGHLISMERGAVRVRRGDQAAEATAVAAHGVGVEVGPRGDALVLRPLAGPILVVCLRGSLRVHLDPQAFPLGRAAREAISLTQGQSLQLTPGLAAPAPGPAAARQVESMIAWTSPELLPASLPGEDLADIARLVGGAEQSFAVALPRAQAAMVAHDPIAALVLLAPFGTQVDRSAPALLLRGRALVAVYLHDAGEASLRQAAKLPASAAAALLELGRLAMARQKWERAARLLALAADRGGPEEAEADHLRGSALEELGEERAARAAQTWSLWNGGGKSAEQALTRLRSNQSLTASARLSAFFDTNTVRSDQLDLATVGDGQLARVAHGLEAWATASYAVDQSAQFNVTSHVAAGARRYLEAGLSALATANVEGGLTGTLTPWGAGATEANLTLSLGGAVQTQAAGGQRLVDGFTIDFQAASPRLYGLFLKITPQQELDPKPDQLSLLDPVTGEVGPVMARSAKILAATLGAVPLHRGAWHLGVELGTVEARHRAERRKVDDFRDLTPALSGRWAPSRRDEVSGNLALRRRDFPAATDGRKDQTLLLELVYDRRLTPTVTIAASFAHEGQSSSRELNSYRREILTLRLVVGL